jgi:HAD superfamily hydrolase (TIGR01490 family)
VRLVVFDLDGTVTFRDTLAPYVFGFLRRRRWGLLKLVRVVPAFAGFLLGVTDRGALKAALIKATLRGHTRVELDAWTSEFVARLLKHGLREQALEAILKHKLDGDFLVLLTAAPDLYAPAIASELGFQESISTGVRWRSERLDGTLSTPNRRGAEKARCLEALLSRFPGAPTTAYGNSAADIPHLKMVEEPRLVNAGLYTRWKASRAGIVPYARWR